MRTALLTVLLLASPAFAHRLNVDVTVHTDPRRLEVRAYYDGGDPSDGSTAVVRDAAGAEAGRTTLDDAGGGTLPLPAGEWTVTVDDRAGHRTTVRFDGRGAGEPPRRWLMVLAGFLLIGGWVGWRMRATG